MLNTLLCSWFLLPWVVVGSTWTGTVTVSKTTAKLVIQMDRDGCHVFITEPVNVNATCTITEATGTKLAFYTRTPETDWLGEIHGSTMTGDFVSDRRLLDEVGSEKGLFTGRLEGSPAPSAERSTSAAVQPEVGQSSDGVAVWRSGDKRSERVAALREVRTVYVDYFGSAEGAEWIREKVINRIVKSGKVSLAETPESADAAFTGIGTVRQNMGGGYDATLVARLVGKNNQILWVGEAKPRRSIIIGNVRIGSVSASSSVADKVVNDLLKAIEKDAKTKR
jgi:hypothetical protein